MLRSRANTLVSVRRVTERNAGRLTAGVDGEVVLTPEAKRELVNRVQHPTEPFTAQPVRRVYIPKPGSNKQRPLGIPVILDRVHQARVVNALEPEWEAAWSHRHTANAFMGVVSNRAGFGLWDQYSQAFSASVADVERLASSPRLTRCNTVWRETPRARIASTIGT